MSRHWLYAIPAALLLAGGAFAAGDGAQKAANDFYKASLSVKSIHIDGIPPAKVRAKLTPYITPALDKALADADKAEDVHAKKTKNQEPPLVEGDLFSSTFEGVTTFHVGACETKGDAAICPVALTYKDSQDKSTSKWTDKLLLVRAGGAWKVDDLAYGGNWDFGNKGRLRDTLKWAVEEAAK
ncbi:MAG: hypothetical protein ACREMY_30690 [bacterium]